MQNTIDEEEILNLINSSLLPRKSFDFIYNGNDLNNPSKRKPITLHKGIEDIVDAFLNGRLNKNNSEYVESLDKWWAREHAAAILAISLLNGNYEDYLPGRYLMYKRLVEDGILTM